MRKNNRRGFTLMEMLLVTAIIVILIAIAVPSVIAIKKNLDIKELDDYAREIYITVQNRLTSMETTFELDELRDKLIDEYASHKLDNFEEKPEDYGDGDEMWRGFYYFTSNDTELTEYMLPAGSVSDEIMNGGYIIELNPNTGDVYSAFYFENKDEYNNCNYESVREALIMGRAQRERKNKSPMIGYYSASVGSVATNLPDYFNVSVNAMNGEELYLEIIIDNIAPVWRWQNYITVDLELTDESGNKATLALESPKHFTYNQSDETVRLYILLDSMEDGYSFKDIVSNRSPRTVYCGNNNTSELASYEYEGDYLNPGDNITVTAIATYSVDGYRVDTNGTPTAVFNSLFAAKDADSIDISCLRHLRNLDEDVYSAVGGGIDITQKSDIGFADGKYYWAGGSYIDAGATAPLSEHTPVNNDELFSDGTVFDGGGKRLYGFVVEGDNTSDDTGIFGTLTDMTIKDANAVDVRANGTGNVGTFAGKIDGCTVTNCGAYLSTANSSTNNYAELASTDTAYANMMEQRLDYYKVIGGARSTAGGFVGSAVDTTFTNSFAAVNVNSQNNAGGFIGSADNVDAANCYASGDVTGDIAGGLCATASNGAYNDCYTTSIVVGDSNGGGFFGVSGTSVTAANGYIYGEITGDSCGSVNGGGRAVSCSDIYYLQQKIYNDSMTVADASGVIPSLYNTLEEMAARDGELLDVSKTFPYNAMLIKQQFPFKSTQDEHHGNWPLKYSLQVSLVYYEKYKDGSYGYYCETYLENTENDVSGAGAIKWLLDQNDDRHRLYDNKEIVEDGYALMSIYQLSKVSYTINGNNVRTMNYNGTAGDYTPSDTGATMTDFGLIDKPYQLRFVNGTDVMTASYVYMYQLPFNLQETSRDDVQMFYDEFKIITAQAYVHNSETGQPVHENYMFYFCPHFAKNAINPDPTVIEANYPGDPGAYIDPDNTSLGRTSPEVYVRTARQLNALGRYSYYWNTNNSGLGNQIEYVQERDIDFGQYTKEYCGVTYNLMDTSSGNIYRNTPIGLEGSAQVTSSGKTYTPDNFKNSYDGRNNKIIDYCCESSNIRFVGLFGETEGAILKNIVMIASDPDNSSAYVRSSFSGAFQSGAVGALAGLVYKQNMDSFSSHARYVTVDGHKITDTIVENCSVSGYEVTYYGNNNVASVVGGLCGYNIGTIKNCSVVSCKIGVVLSRTSNQAHTVGGIAGSNFYKIQNCVAGTGGENSLYISAKNNCTAYIGGISGYAVVTWTEIYNGTVATVTDSYSYCTISKQNSTTNAKYYAVTPTQPILACITGNKNERNYYVEDFIDDDVSLVNVSGVTSKEYSEMASMTINGMGRAETSYRWGVKKVSSRFPFPTPTVDSDGDYIHYGQWPASPNAVSGKLGAAGKRYNEVEINEIEYSYEGENRSYSSGAPSHDGIYLYANELTSGLNAWSLDDYEIINSSNRDVTDDYNLTLDSDVTESGAYEYRDIILSYDKAASVDDTLTITLELSYAGYEVELTVTTDYEYEYVVTTVNFNYGTGLYGIGNRSISRTYEAGTADELPSVQSIYSGQNSGITYNTTWGLYSYNGGYYTFAGWSETVGGESITNARFRSIANQGGSVTLYALWEQYSTYTLTYDKNGRYPETFPNGGEYRNGETVNLSFDVSNAYVYNGGYNYTTYVFAGWATTPEGEAVYKADGTTSISMTSDVTLYAVWKQNVTLTYDGGEATTGRVPASVTVPYGTTVTINFETGYNNFSNYLCKKTADERIYLTGWMDEALNVYNDIGDTITLTENVTLTARFSKDDNVKTIEYNVRYNAGSWKHPKYEWDKWNETYMIGKVYNSLSSNMKNDDHPIDYYYWYKDSNFDSEQRYCQVGGRFTVDNNTPTKLYTT